MSILLPRQQAAFDALVPCAIAAERTTGFPAEAICSAFAIESAWGEKPTGEYNYFGLTRATNPDRQMKFCPTHEEMTQEQFNQLPQDERESVTQRVDLGGGRYRYSLSRWFPSFDSMQQAVNAYVRLITAGPRYAKAWNQYKKDHNMDGLLDGIAAAGYATGGSYGKLLRQIANGSRVAMPVQAARKKAMESV